MTAWRIDCKTPLEIFFHVYILFDESFSHVSLNLYAKYGVVTFHFNCSAVFGWTDDLGDVCNNNVNRITTSLG